MARVRVVIVAVAVAAVATLFVLSRINVQVAPTERADEKKERIKRSIFVGTRLYITMILELINDNPDLSEQDFAAKLISKPYTSCFDDKRGTPVKFRVAACRNKSKWMKCLRRGDEHGLVATLQFIDDVEDQQIHYNFYSIVMKEEANGPENYAEFVELQ
jgi:hypothetical protein